ncbi:glutamine amidotransferase [Burkholderia sp. Bp9143]|uniref:glutamine amidotransferase n=1 Tax=Burkholderia sp. Bp9143 TaxID=2184574 RepID=UPI001C8A0DD7|nr:glutamine amidotransferase [Burkholderia sp. Bp9143]
MIVVQAGTPPEEIRGPFGDLPTWFCRALERSAETVEVVRVFEGETLPRPDANRAAVITGSWSMVTDRHPWSEATAQWIREAMSIDMPLFGVCYGHQLMAHALGGRVDYHPDGLEVGCQTICLLPTAADDPLLESLPLHFAAHLTHAQTIIELPPGARALAYSAHDRHQIVRYGPNAISTQFHPEFTPELSAACIRRRASTLLKEGKNPDAMVDALQDTHQAAGLLRRFVDSTC